MPIKEALTREQVLAAFRENNPNLKKYSDDQILKVIGQEAPNIIRHLVDSGDTDAAKYKITSEEAVAQTREKPDVIRRLIPGGRELMSGYSPGVQRASLPVQSAPPQAPAIIDRKPHGVTGSWNDDVQTTISSNHPQPVESKLPGLAEYRSGKEVPMKPQVAEPKEVDLSFLDDDKPAVDLSFLDNDYDALEQTRKNQAAKFPTEAEGGEPPIKPWSLSTIVGTAASDLNPLNLIRPFAHPVQTGEDLGQARLHSEQKVGEAIHDYRTTGDKLAGAEALTRGAVNMIPVVGPFLANAAEESGRDPSQGVGHAVAAVAGPKIYEGAKNLDLAGAKDFISKLRENGVRGTVMDAINDGRGITPENSLFKALRPRNFVRDADKRIGGAMPEINAGAKLLGIDPTDMASVNKSIEAQIGERLKQQKALIGTEKFNIKGKPIADSVWASIPKLDLLRMGDEAQAALHESIYNTWDRDFTPQELAEFLKDSNASRSVQGYFAKLPGQQIALDRVADKASAMAENHAIRQTLMDSLEAYKGTGAGLKQVNLALRDLIATKDLLDRRYNVEVRQAVENLPQQVSKLAALGRYGAAAKALIGGHPGVAALDVFTGMGEKGLANFIRELNSTNGQIASAFRRFKGEPDAVPLNPVSRYNRALPPASSTVVPTSETGSASPGSTSAVSQWQRPEAIELPRTTNVSRDTTTGQMRQTDALNLEKFIEQEKGLGRTDLAQRMRPNVFQKPAEEPIIDADIIKLNPKPDTRMPASSLPEQKLLPKGSGQQAGRPVTPMPDKLGDKTYNGPGAKPTKDAPLTQREFLNLSTPEYEIQRDPKTGRFKKVFKGTSK